MSRGFGVAAGLDPEVAAPLAERCAELGYTSVWSNDTPVGSGLATLADFATGTDSVDLGVAVGPVIASIHEKRDEFRAQIMIEGALRKKPKLRTGAG